MYPNSDKHFNPLNKIKDLKNCKMGENTHGTESKSYIKVLWFRNPWCTLYCKPKSIPHEVGGTWTDFYTTQEYHIQMLPTTNKATIQSWNNGTTPHCPKITGGTLLIGDSRRRTVKRHFHGKYERPQNTKWTFEDNTRPDKALKLTIIIKLGARSQLAIQNKNNSDPSMVSVVGRSEPVLAISNSRYRGNPRQPRGGYHNPDNHNSNHSIIAKFWTIVEPRTQCKMRCAWTDMQALQ